MTMSTNRESIIDFGGAFDGESGAPLPSVGAEIVL